MSGIAGIFHLDGEPPDPEVIESMARSISRRGPNGTETWISGSVALARSSLLTAPRLSLERSPLISADGDIALVADARLDYDGELKDLLGISTAESVGDDRLILLSYQRWGEDCVDHLLGDFAFVVWNARTQSLFGARDSMGLRPLVYFHSPQIFACASETEALLQLPRVSRRVDELHIANYVVGTRDDLGSTFFAEIKRLPRGQTLTVGRKGMRRRRYWSLAFPQKLRPSRDEDYAEQFREVFGRAVSSRLRNAEPIGSMLSGGLDSSSVTGMARSVGESTSSDIRTFSLTYPSLSEMDESEFIQAMLELGSFDPTFVPADSLPEALDLDSLLTPSAEPATLSANNVINWNLYAAARRSGVTAVLDGFDGDFVAFRSWAYLIELRRRGHWIRLMREQRVNRDQGTVPWPSAVYSNIVYPLLSPASPARLWKATRSRRKREFPWELDVPISRDLAQRVHFADHWKDLMSRSPSRYKSAQDLHHRLLTDAFTESRIDDWSMTAAQFGIEQRSPFMDRRVVELCLVMPPEQKYHHGWDRYMVRRAMEGLLPPKVQWRYGKPASPHIASALLPFVMERTGALLGSDDPVWRYLDREAIRRERERAATQRVDNAVLRLWQTAALSKFLREHAAQ